MHWQRRHAYYVQGVCYSHDLAACFFQPRTNGILEQRDFFKRYIRDGRFYLSDLDQTGYVYLSTIEEFRAEFAVAGFTRLVLACVESFWATSTAEMCHADLGDATAAVS